MTKKEYISKLKKELDTIELRYQHLINENCMIGEDFRSRAHGNLLYSQSLEQRIEELQAEIVNLKTTIDEKDLELVIKERESESFQMLGEENLTAFAVKRDERDNLQGLLNHSTNLNKERA